MKLHNVTISQVAFNFACLTTIVFMLSPSWVFIDGALLVLDSPSGVSYPLWFAHLNLIDLLMVISSLIIYIAKIHKPIILNYIGLILLALITAIGGVFLQAINGSSAGEYYDGIIYFIRMVLYAYVLTYCIAYQPTKLIKYIMYSVSILIIISLMAVVGSGYKGVLDGRINLLGMGPNISAGIVVLMILFLDKNICGSFFSKYERIALYAVNLLYLPFTGSRRVLLYIVFYGLYKLLSHKNLNTKILTLSVMMFFVMGGIIWSDQIQSFSEGIGMTTVIRLYDTFSQIQGGTIEDGRSGMYSGAGQLLANNPFGLGLSDWAIQEHLAQFTTGSHTHNLFIQMYLKIGIFMIIPLMITSIYLLTNRWSAYIPIYGVLFLENMSGHGFWNQKYIYIFLLIIIMNVIYKNDTPHNRICYP